LRRSIEKKKMRVPQQIGSKGSLKWIQTLINEKCDILNQDIGKYIKEGIALIEWVSPKKEDDYAEYRDEDFLKVLGIEKYKSQLQDFWPKAGPQWDALGKLKDKYYFVVEAKANIPEITSSTQAKAEKSKIKIKNSLHITKQFLGASSGQNWETGFYQYANRISHLYFLRELCGLNAYLIFIYFCNDYTHIPTNIEQWQGSLELQKHLMCLNRHKYQSFVLDIFIDVNEIENRTSG